MQKTRTKKRQKLTIQTAILSFEFIGLQIPKYRYTQFLCLFLIFSIIAYQQVQNLSYFRCSYLITYLLIIYNLKTFEFRSIWTKILHKVISSGYSLLSHVLFIYSCIGITSSRIRAFLCLDLKKLLLLVTPSYGYSRFVFIVSERFQ